jgi:hypothetical protein
MVSNTIQKRPYECPQCSRGFYTQRDLDDHIRNDHQRQRGF